jgi:hypothetical protein
LPAELPREPERDPLLSCIIKKAELHGNPGINHAGSVQGALLTWEILAYFAVRQYLLILFFFEKTPLSNVKQ